MTTSHRLSGIRNWGFGLALAVASVAAGLLATTAADAAIYMKIEGVPADAHDGRFSGWSEVVGLGQRVRRVEDPTNPTQPFTPAFSCVLRKRIDQVSPALLKRCGEGTAISRILLVSEENGTVHYRVALENVLISSYQVQGGGAGTEIPTEQFSLNFTKITWSSVTVGDQGEVVGGLSTNFDLVAGTGGEKVRPPFRAEVSAQGEEAGVVTLRCPVEKGRRYRVALTPDLSNRWQSVIEFTADADGIIEQKVRNLPPVAFLRFEEIE